MGFFTLAHITLVGVCLALAILLFEVLSAAYRRWGAHLRPSRHPWVWGMSGYLVVAQVLDIIWPWHGWSLRLAVAVLFVACWWLTTRWVNRLERL